MMHCKNVLRRFTECEGRLCRHEGIENAMLVDPEWEKKKPKESESERKDVTPPSGDDARAERRDVRSRAEKVSRTNDAKTSQGIARAIDHNGTGAEEEEATKAAYRELESSARELSAACDAMVDRLYRSEVLRSNDPKQAVWKRQVESNIYSLQRMRMALPMVGVAPGRLRELQDFAAALSDASTSTFENNGNSKSELQLVSDLIASMNKRTDQLAQDIDAVDAERASFVYRWLHGAPKYRYHFRTDHPERSLETNRQ